MRRVLRRASDGSGDALPIFLLLSFLYISHHCRTFGPGDSAQHVLSALTLGVSRPPGYPLYVFLAHLFSLVPFGSAASMVNAFSGVLQAAAASLLYLGLRRWGCRWSSASFAALSLGLAPLFWYYAEVAEVRGLNDALATASILLCIDGPAWLLGAVAGLGVSHHPTFMLTLPALAYLASRRLKKPRDWSTMAICAAAGCAAPYALLYLRLRLGPAPLYNPDNVRTLHDVVDLFLRRRTGGLTSFAAGLPGLVSQSLEPLRALREGGWFAGLVLHDLMIPGIILAALGCWNLWKTRRDALVFWALWILGTLLPVVLISSQEVRFGDLDYLRAMVLRHFLLPYIGVFALAGFGADWLLSRSRAELGWVLAFVAVIGPLVARPVDLSRADPARSYAEDILRSSGPRDIILLDSDEASFAMMYFDVIEHAAADRVFLPLPMLSDPGAAARLAARHPDLKLPRDGAALSHSVSRWRKLNPDRPFEAEPTMRDALVQISSACFPQGILVRVGDKFPPLKESAAQARAFLDDSSAEKVPSWGLRPWTQEVYLLKAYAMILEFYASFVRHSGDERLSARVQDAFDGAISVR